MSRPGGRDFFFRCSRLKLKLTTLLSSLFCNIENPDIILFIIHFFMYTKNMDKRKRSDHKKETISLF